VATKRLCDPLRSLLEQHNQQGKKDIFGKFKQNEKKKNIQSLRQFKQNIKITTVLGSN